VNKGPLEWHYCCTKFHEYLPSGSKVISGGGGHRQTGDLISLLSFLESRLESVLGETVCGHDSFSIGQDPMAGFLNMVMDLHVL
jgi:hypothetical protein